MSFEYLRNNAVIISAINAIIIGGAKEIPVSIVSNKLSCSEI